jgi:hypothetical protein
MKKRGKSLRGRWATPKGMSYDDQRDGFVGAVEAGDSAKWKVGFFWHNLQRYKLWKGTYPDGGAFLEGELGARGLEVPKPSDLSKWARVAKTFEEKIADNVRFFRLERALIYWRKRGNTTFSRTDPGKEPIDVPQEDGSVVTKPLTSCSEEDLKVACAGVRKPRLGPPLTADEQSKEKAGQDLCGTQGAFHLVHSGNSLVAEIRYRGDVKTLAELGKGLSRLF